MHKRKIFQWSNSPPLGWKNTCAVSGNLFQHPEWQNVLHRGFDSETYYVWNLVEQLSFTITVFKAGPFRVGYMGFPVAGTLRGSATHSDLAQLRASGFPIDLLRIPSTAFSPSFEAKYRSIASPETAIVNLSAWNVENIPKLRRDLKKAQRGLFTVADLSEPDPGTLMFDLYRNTVVSKGGKLRYTQKYFQSLADFSRRTNRLRCIGAFKDAAFCGYVACALNEDRAYYLHGATALNWKSSGVSDLLICEAIGWAQKNGMKMFNLMASPSNQPSLISYKEKMGGVTRLQHTVEVPFAPLRFQLFKAAVWVHEQYRRVSTNRA